MKTAVKKSNLERTTSVKSKKTPKNKLTYVFYYLEHFAKALLFEKRITVFFGGRGAGKSYQIALRLVQMCFEKDYRIFICRKYAASNSKSTKLLMRRIIEQLPPKVQDSFRWRQSHSHIQNKWTGAEIYFGGLQDPDSVKGLEDFDLVWVEEASEISQDAFEKLYYSVRGGNIVITEGGRVRRVSEKDLESGSPKKLILSLNPPREGYHHWIYKGFFSSKPGYNNFSTHHSTYKMNIPLSVGDPEFGRSMEKMKDRDLFRYERDVLGNWSQEKESLVYPMFEVTEQRLDLELGYLLTSVSYGLDFGYTNPTALLKVCQLELDKEPVVFVACEVVHTQVSPNALGGLLREKEPKALEHVIYADPSSPSLIGILNQEGFYVKASKRFSNSILLGIDFIRSKKLIIHQDCVHTLKELENYRWETNKDGSINPTLPQKKDDHCMDALRYALCKETYQAAKRFVLK